MPDRPKLIKLTENKQFKTLLKRVDHILQNLISIDIPITDLNHTHFGAALFIQRQLAPDYDEKHRNTERKSSKKEPPGKQNSKKRSKSSEQNFPSSVHLVPQQDT